MKFKFQKFQGMFFRHFSANLLKAHFTSSLANRGLLTFIYLFFFKPFPSFIMGQFPKKITSMENKVQRAKKRELQGFVLVMNFLHLWGTCVFSRAWQAPRWCVNEEGEQAEEWLKTLHAFFSHIVFVVLNFMSSVVADSQRLFPCLCWRLCSKLLSIPPPPTLTGKFI